MTRASHPPPCDCGCQDESMDVRNRKSPLEQIADVVIGACVIAAIILFVGKFMAFLITGNWVW